MELYFDIFGTPIPYKEIKDFRVVQKEYIYRPMYEEYSITEKSLLWQQTSKKYRFVTMVPYAAILDESDRRWIFSGKGRNFKENIGAEILNDIRETVGEKLKIKAVRGKRYLCMNQTGRVFPLYLDEIPALINMEDGRTVEVDKDNPLYSSLGDSVLPAINIVPALLIKGKENFIFWGNGIQLENIEYEYERLKMSIEQYSIASNQKLINSKNVSLPKLPTFIKRNETNSEILESNSEAELLE